MYYLAGIVLKNSAGISEYELSIINEQSSITFYNQSTKDTFNTLPSFIPTGSYYWYVKAINIAGGYTISNTDSFTIYPYNIDSVSGYVTYDNSFNTPLAGVKIILQTKGGISIDSTFTEFLVIMFL